jgi:ABC-type branched-subunit amino acid transport system substrate-binding protein
VILLAASTWLAGPVRAQDQVDPIRIGMSAAFSGPSRALGIELYRGSTAYFEHINAEFGGVHGRPIEIVPLDDGYNPDPAVHNTIELVREREVLALFNYVGTPTVTRILPLLKTFSHQHVHLFFPFTGAQPQREPPYDDYVFNLRASYELETLKLINRLIVLGRERIAVCYQADAYGRSGWEGVRKALRPHGLEMVAEATYRRGASFTDSMAVQARIIAQSRPDAVILVASYEAAAAFIRDARDAGLDVPIANLSFVGSENLLELLRSISDQERNYTTKLITTQVVPSYVDLSLPAVQEYRLLMDRHDPAPPAFVGDYRPQRYGFVSFEGFLNAKTMVEALRRMGAPPSRRRLALAAENLGEVDLGVFYPIRYGPDDHQGLEEVYFTTAEHGVFVPIREWSRWMK